MKATRLDLQLVKAHHFTSRTQAQAAILAARVKVNGKIITKAATLIEETDHLEAEAAHPYVSRAALKLVHGLDMFNISPAQKTCLDLGASTGGFTQVLLENGAEKIYAIDVGINQLDPRLAQNERVISLEKQDARNLKLPEDVDLIVCDLSFISLTKALAHPLQFLKPNGFLIALIKPQFEVGRENIGKGGIVKDPALHQLACENLRSFLTAQNIRVSGIYPSPLLGGDGNQEFLIGGKKC